MYQAHAQELLNQKESENDAIADDSQAPLTLATQRLAMALDLLEQNLQRMMGINEDGQQQLQFFEEENYSLRQEREHLTASVAQLQGQYNSLHNVASTIYGKLDDSIKKITQLIES